MLGNEADAEDVTQELFLRIWQYAARWQPGRARFETWMHRVTLNLCYDRLRRRREIVVDKFPELPDPALSVVERQHREETARRVQAELGKLPDRQRAAIVLCHHEGLSNIEAAQVLQVSVEALESLLARGRRALKAALAADANELLAGIE
jgi:RNA polymerase sigma-70 factor (ECF subfamily)